MMAKFNLYLGWLYVAGGICWLMMPMVPMAERLLMASGCIASAFFWWLIRTNGRGGGLRKRKPASTSHQSLTKLNQVG